MTKLFFQSLCHALSYVAALFDITESWHILHAAWLSGSEANNIT